VSICQLAVHGWCFEGCLTLVRHSLCLQATAAADWDGLQAQLHHQEIQLQAKDQQLAAMEMQFHEQNGNVSQLQAQLISQGDGVQVSAVFVLQLFLSQKHMKNNILQVVQCIEG